MQAHKKLDTLIHCTYRKAFLFFFGAKLKIKRQCRLNAATPATQNEFERKY